MTEARRQPRKSLNERAQRSDEATRAFWSDRLASAARPQDLVQENWALLQSKLAKLERKALARVERAQTSEAKVAAGQQLAEVRERIIAVCSDAATELARLADQIHTERR